MKFQLKDVLPNPNRDLKLNPLKEEKIASLIESIETTGWWKNVVGRQREDGKLELGYGHHRYEALLRKYGKEYEAEFIVEHLSDDTMRQMMARENDETYRNDIVAVMENVQAAVRGLAEGTVSRERFPVPSPQANINTIRYAPSYIPGRNARGSSPSMAYTSAGLAFYLGAINKNGNSYEAAERVEAALIALENIERKLWDKSTLRTFRKADNGPILADRVLKAARDVQHRAAVIQQNEKAKAEEAKRNADSIQERLKAAEKAQKEAEAEQKRLAKEREAALNKAADEKAAAIKKEQEEAKQRAAEAEEKRKQAEKEWKANEKARQASVDAQRKAKEEAERRAQAQWNATVKSLIDQLNTLLSNEHHLYEAAKVLGRDKRLTDVQRKALLKAADGIHVRIDNVKRLINPDLNKKKK